MRFNLESINAGQTVVVHFLDHNLDVSNVKTFKEKLQPVLDGHQAVLLDMGGIDFVDSSGLGALLSCLRTMNNKEGQLKLFAMTKPVQALFELVRMHRIFAIYNTQDEALAAL
jgi:anti-sigma B factor antagonist